MSAPVLPHAAERPLPAPPEPPSQRTKAQESGRRRQRGPGPAKSRSTGAVVDPSRGVRVLPRTDRDVVRQDRRTAQPHRVMLELRSPGLGGRAAVGTLEPHLCNPGGPPWPCRAFSSRLARPANSTSPSVAALTPAAAKAASAPCRRKRTRESAQLPPPETAEPATDTIRRPEILGQPSSSGASGSRSGR